MKLKYLMIVALGAITLATACGGSKSEKKSQEENATEVVEAQPEPVVVQTEDVVCNGNKSKASYIVISKETMTLKLYDTNNKVIFNFPIALGKNYGNKQMKGDMKTPEGEFTVQQITNSSTWTHDFGDGKGEIPHAYGDWFIRLKTPPHTGIGIHGTHLPESIGTRASEGCIRMYNENLNELKPLVYVGMRVVIETSRRDMEADGRAVPSPSAKQTATVAQTTTTTEPATTATAEPAKVEQKPAVDAASVTPGEIIEHTIESGELIGSIAIKYNTSTKRILELNPEVEPTKIRVGQKIRVEKGAPKQEAPQQEVAKQESTADPNAVYHVVESGDYLGKIAEKHGTSVNKILDLNPGIEPTKIRPGQKVRVK